MQPEDVIFAGIVLQAVATAALIASTVLNVRLTRELRALRRRF